LEEVRTRQEHHNPEPRRLRHRRRAWSSIKVSLPGDLDGKVLLANLSQSIVPDTNFSNLCRIVLMNGMLFGGGQNKTGASQSRAKKVEAPPSSMELDWAALAACILISLHYQLDIHVFCKGLLQRTDASSLVEHGARLRETGCVGPLKQAFAENMDIQLIV
jgi:hypothetical protein